MIMSSGLGAFDLSGKVALVTGANTGLGQGMALALADAGADIAAAGRSAMDETVAAVRSRGRKAAEIRSDLSADAAPAAAVAGTVEALGRLDILINNAGIIRRDEALDFGVEDWDEVMQVDLRAAFFLAQAAARQFVVQGGGGKIVNIASVLSFQGGIRVPSYTAAKSGLLGLTRALANEWAGRGINVNAIAPGYCVTANTAALRADEARYQEILGRIPAGRCGQPQDLGGAVVFLCSAASDYVHGIALPVDGGWLAR